MYIIYNQYLECTCRTKSVKNINKNKNRNSQKMYLNETIVLLNNFYCPLLERTKTIVCDISLHPYITPL